ncbi:sulfurtransferase complex subunit TusD [Cognaticolwellia mytili]|uniref:sulfurtransferase complex subunit TusD n=1 Tax=Cognaticolwellia mytili TaxID=1888913 RepID=UPI000A16D364|nr:sulfurtransferase complex subunit TusD [Cognaticolwellia mytili]
MQNTLALVVTTPPNSNLTTTAINLVKRAIDKDVAIVGVFFYQDGVLNAAKHLSIPNDEYQALQHWQQLSNEYHVPLHLCVSAAEKRGLTDELSNNENSNIDKAFIVSGLGELVELTSKAERVVQL